MNAAALVGLPSSAIEVDGERQQQIAPHRSIGTVCVAIGSLRSETSPRRREEMGDRALLGSSGRDPDSKQTQEKERFLWSLDDGMAMTRRIPTALAFGMLLLTGACVDSMGMHGADGSGSSRRTSVAVGRPTAKHAAGANQAKSKPSAEAAKSASPAATGAADTFCDADSASESKDLIGLDQQRLQQLLGEPISINANAPGKIWRYRNRCCELNVSLFPNLRTHSFQVLSYEVISNDESERGKRICLADLSGSNAARADGPGK